MHQNGREYMNEFGIKVSAEPLHLEGRVLQAPKIVYKENALIMPRDGVWDLKSNQFFAVNVSLLYTLITNRTNVNFFPSRDAKSTNG